jgi:hypothetical protein
MAFKIGRFKIQSWRSSLILFLAMRLTFDSRGRRWWKRFRSSMGRGDSFQIQSSYSDNLESAILNLEFLAPGLYSLILTTQDGAVYSEKVIIE